ncbi:MAG TPA: NAD(P)-dependent oxidoreductase [Tepidisphaeraceae bacterium]|nr:NAD(P)-dependent oxidoreductase [Tepidisphaeraceae bacterium]
MKVAVTGAVGHLGRVVCRQLLNAGHTVLATDLRADNELGIHVEVANLVNRESCYRLIEGADVLVHLGNHPHALGRPAAEIYSHNVSINANIFQAALELGIKKWIFASSIQAMRGKRSIHNHEPSALAYLPVDGQAPYNASNLYGLSKVAGEQMLQYYSAAEGRTTIAIRYPMLLNMAGSPFDDVWFPKPYPHLDEVFSYLDFGDAASLILAIISTPLSGYHCYQPAAKNNLQRRPAAELIREFYPNVPLRQPIETIQHLVDLTPIEHETGWSPKYE